MPADRGGTEMAKASGGARGPHGRFPGGPLARLLLVPLAALYRGAMGARGVAYDRGWLESLRPPIPAISVGNLTVGGTGKTPVVRWLVEELLRRGERPSVIHGGYAADEPDLHRLWHPDIPVYAQRDRPTAVERAAAAGATVAVLDDAFQHRRLQRDLDLVLVSAEQWAPPRRLLPLGPWREPPRALDRADAVLVTRKTATAPRAAAVADAVTAHTDAPIVLVALRPAGWIDPAGTAREGVPAGIAVAGIAWPEAFFENAESAGATVLERLSYPDHHEYGEREVERILRGAGVGSIITTAKDAVKLARRIDPDRLWVLEQEVTIEANEETLIRLLEGTLA